MARKLKKFSEGGSDKYKARYNRKVADIESDYKKAQARKTGRAAEVAKAKYEQRLADARDDLAKWTKSDRTDTRAGEKAAEKNLSMTRKFGARSSENLVAKAENKLAEKAPLSSVDTTDGKPKTSSFKEAFATARKAGDKTFTWNGKSFTTQVKGEGPKRTGAGKAPAGKAPAGKAPAGKAPAGKAPAGKPNMTPATIAPPASLSLANKGKTSTPTASSAVKTPASLSLANKGKNVPVKPTFEQKRAARLEEWRKAAEAPSASRYVQDRYKYGKETGMVGNFKKGGNVKKYGKGGSTSPLGTQKEIVARANRTPYEPIPKKGPDAPKRKPLKPAGMKGYAKGGSVDGIAKKGKTRCKGMK